MDAIALPLADAPAARLREVLDLNAAVAEWTSPLDEGALARLIDAAAFAEARVEGNRVAAVLLGFHEGAAYGSPNFLWFRDRYPRFAYIDRVVTAPWAQGRGHARVLYHRFAEASRGQERLACEVNLTPPNPGSDAFHARLGFEEVGRGEPHLGKRVRYLARALPWAGQR